MMWLLYFVVAASIAATVSGCGLDEEGLVPTHRTTEVDGQAPDGEGPADGAPDAARPDSPDERDSTSGSCPSPPDCSNPACKAEGYVCTPAAATGWSIAAVDFTKDSPCPPGYGTSQTVATQPTGGPASCGCECSVGSLPSCVVGELENTYGDDSSCSIGSVDYDANDGACMNATHEFQSYSKVLSVPGATGGTCAATPSKALPASGSTSSYVCPLGGPASTKGCSSDDVCVATTGAMSQCVIQAGSSLSCPGPYTVSHAVGSSIVDSRDCGGSCACAAQPTATCGDETWTFYTGANCKGTAETVDMDGSCDATGALSGYGYGSYQYTASPSGETCGAATATPSAIGSLSLADPRTVCCLPP
jgi:hypothetical protein